MSKLFDALDDETEPTAGAEIGKALSVAVSELNKSNEAMVSTLSTMLAQSMKDAIGAIESKSITVQQPEKITAWKFKIEYVKLDGFMRPSIVTATACKG